MRFLSRLRGLWHSLTRRRRFERDLDEELRASVETLARRYATQGMAADEARRAAVRDLAGPGGIVHIKESVRDVRAGAGLDALHLDLRYAWRSLWRAPALTGVVVATLAIGIGANTAIFSIVHAMLLKPLPYRDADRLAFIWLDRSIASATMSALGYPRGPMSGPDFGDLRKGTHTFSDFAGIWASGTIALTGEGGPEQLRGALVTTNFFQVLGVEPALGRVFRAEDSAPGAEATIVLGWDLFQRRFGGNPAIVGQRIDVNDQLVTVIGVMPRHFRLLLPADASVPDRLQAFAPFWPDLEHGPRRNLFLRVIGRMRPGVTIEQARDDVAAMARGVSQAIGSPRAFTTVQLQADDVREIRGPLLALFAGVGILLAIACVNVAGLLIARAASRARETALRLALGASRGRLVRRWLAEGLLLTLTGCAAGVLTGYAALQVLLALRPASLDRLEASRIDPTVLAFTIGVSLAWGLLFSLAPVTELVKDRVRGWASANLLASGRTGGAATPPRYRVRAALVIVQVALSLVLLVGAGLLMRAFVEVLRVDPGFNAGDHLTFRLLIPDRHPFVPFTEELHRRLSAVPGVTGVGTISHVPYDDLPNWGLPYTLEPKIPLDAPTADARAISPGAFEALGVELLDGRFFTNDDQDPKHAVVIVDDMMARLLWPGRSAIGQRLTTRVGANERATVVGVVRHLKLRSLVDEMLPQIFVPWRIAQRNPTAYVLRTEADPASLAAAVRATIASIDPRLAVYDVRPLRDYVESARSMRRFTMLLAAAFALSALALTCIGIYGVLAYAVAHRRHELGVRRALGAQAGQLLRGVLREGLAFALLGCAVGLAGAAVAARFLQSQLYTVHPRDPVSYTAAIALVVAGVLIACWIPARRAVAVSPMDALRSE